jgi:hypothetical protein
MPDPVIVNPQITDAVTQTNVKVLGEGPAEGVDIAIQAVAHSTGLAMENATQTQGGMQQINNAAIAALITQINSVTPAPKAQSL